MMMENEKPTIPNASKLLLVEFRMTPIQANWNVPRAMKNITTGTMASPKYWWRSAGANTRDNVGEIKWSKAGKAAAAAPILRTFFESKLDEPLSASLLAFEESRPEDHEPR